MFKLNTEQKRKLKNVGTKHNLKLMFLFGSVAVDQAHNLSDIDIAVLSPKYPTLKEILQIQDELSPIFPQKKVDIAVLNRANPLLAHQSSCKSILLFGKQRDFFNFQISAFLAYNDYMPYFRLEGQHVREKITKYSE